MLTHAHVDHCGYLPALVRDGFEGPVWCSPRTAELAGIVLPDCGHLHEEEAACANQRGYSKHSPALPLYTEADAIRSLDSLTPVHFGAGVEVAPMCDSPSTRPATSSARRSPSCSIAAARGRARAAGVLRRSRPAPPPAAAAADAPRRARPDVVVVESTYGDRHHDDADALERLAGAITRTARPAGAPS